MVILENQGIFFGSIPPLCVRLGSSSNRHRGEKARPRYSLRRVHVESGGEPGFVGEEIYDILQPIP